MYVNICTLSTCRKKFIGVFLLLSLHYYYLIGIFIILYFDQTLLLFMVGGFQISGVI